MHICVCMYIYTYMHTHTRNLCIPRPNCTVLVCTCMSVYFLDMCAYTHTRTHIHIAMHVKIWVKKLHMSRYSVQKWDMKEDKDCFLGTILCMFPFTRSHPLTHTHSLVHTHTHVCVCVCVCVCVRERERERVCVLYIYISAKTKHKWPHTCALHTYSNVHKRSDSRLIYIFTHKMRAHWMHIQPFTNTSIKSSVNIFIYEYSHIYTYQLNETEVPLRAHVMSRYAELHHRKFFFSPHRVFFLPTPFFFPHSIAELLNFFWGGSPRNVTLCQALQDRSSPHPHSICHFPLNLTNCRDSEFQNLRFWFFLGGECHLMSPCRAALLCPFPHPLEFFSTHSYDSLSVSIFFCLGVPCANFLYRKPYCSLDSDFVWRCLILNETKVPFSSVYIY